MSQTATLRRVDSNGGESTQQITINSQAVRSTSGEMIEIPLNRYSLHDTKELAALMSFFTPSPTGDRTASNYDTTPPNPAEPTIITGLSITLDRAILQSDAVNSINATAIINAIAGGLVQVVRQDTQAVLVEAPAGRFFDLSNVDVGTDAVVVGQSAKAVDLDEVIYVPRGIAYRVNITLPSGATLPTDANWNTSALTKPALKVRAEHRGNNGR